MGVQAMVKHAMGNIRKNNTSNAQTGRLWSRRVTEIAADLERSSDTEKKAKFERLITNVAAEFKGDDFQARTGPDTFLKRQNAIIAAEAELNEFKAPPLDREAAMKEAVQKDMQKLDKNIRDICESSLPILKELCDILPSRRELRAGGISSDVLSGNEAFSKLQVAMADVNDKIANLQNMGYIDSTVIVTILQLEDPDADPVHRPCNIEATFGELLQNAFMAADADEGEEQECDDEEDDEDDVIPDVWVKRWDTTHNSVTKTGQWWEHQNESLKLREVFKSEVGGNADLSEKKWHVEIVAKKRDYVVALVNDNGQELGKALELPNSRKKKQMCAHEHLKRIFANHEVARVLELQTGKDASETQFNRLFYRPKTNPLYIELKAVGQQQQAPTSPSRVKHGGTI